MLKKMRFSLLVASLLGMGGLLNSCFNASKVTSAPANAPERNSAPTPSFFALQANSLTGLPINFETFRGKKIIILNVASKCGYTPQYADWQAFYARHQDKVVVLGFPCNQFMNQEPGQAADIQEFCEKNYGVDFPMFEKIDVKGPQQSPVYRWLSDPTQNGWNSDVPSWNFCKYLIDEEGRLTHFFGSGVKPDSPEFAAAIKL